MPRIIREIVSQEDPDFKGDYTVGTYVLTDLRG